MAPPWGQHKRKAGPVVNVWTVVTTHDRHGMLAALLTDLNPEHTVIVDHASTPPVIADVARVIRCDCTPNISHLWNLGLNYVDSRARGTGYFVAVLNDDLRIPPGTLEGLAEALDDTGAAVAFPDVHGLLRPGQTDVRTKPGPVNLFTRMTGFCFMLRGSIGLRADEELVWWYGDDDLEWRAAERGGTVRVGGVTVEHLSPNGSVATDVGLAEQTVLDRATFVAKWGNPPW